MTKQHITDLIVLDLLLAGLSLAWDAAADSAWPIGVPQGVGTLGIRG